MTTGYSAHLSHESYTYVRMYVMARCGIVQIKWFEERGNLLEDMDQVFKEGEKAYQGATRAVAKVAPASVAASSSLGE